MRSEWHARAHRCGEATVLILGAAAVPTLRVSVTHAGHSGCHRVSPPRLRAQPRQPGSASGAPCRSGTTSPTSPAGPKAPPCRCAQQQQQRQQGLRHEPHRLVGTGGLAFAQLTLRSASMRSTILAFESTCAGNCCDDGETDSTCQCRDRTGTSPQCTVCPSGRRLAVAGARTTLSAAPPLAMPRQQQALQPWQRRPGPVQLCARPCLGPLAPVHCARLLGCL